MSNSNFHNSIRNRNNEFYTLYEDIDRELKHYKFYFKDAVVFCNCNDVYEGGSSNFFNYFVDNFHKLQLKKLIASHYSPDANGFAGDSFLIEHEGTTINKIPLCYSGDFRSGECEDILYKSDIVVTNPPFSLFREFISQLMRMQKKFLILGNMGSIAYMDISTLFLENKLWMGESPRGHNFFTEDGSLQSVNTCWFTNLPNNRRNKEIVLTEKYDPKLYPKYDNYDAIEVSRVSKIPKDYYGKMGVPITFMEKYNPSQFKIVGLCRTLLGEGESNFLIDGKMKYMRFVIQRKEGI